MHRRGESRLMCWPVGAKVPHGEGVFVVGETHHQGDGGCELCAVLTMISGEPRSQFGADRLHD